MPDSPRRIVVATAEPIGERMAGPAIRAWNFAEQLAHRHHVELVTLATCDRFHPLFGVRQVDRDALVELERWMDVLVFQGGLLKIHPFLASTDKPIVADVYDPFHLENLEPTSGHSDVSSRTSNVMHLTRVLNDQLCRADFFLCASERQRDFWLGSLSALGRITPAGYDDDPTFRHLIDVVPFGVPDELPARTRGDVIRGVFPGIGAGDFVILWGGGVYNWFDPVSLVEAVDRVRRDVPEVRLLFLGMRHPNPAVPEMSAATRVRGRARDLAIDGTHVFFNEDWVAYDDRVNYLLEADLGVSTHHEHIETAFSFRTRILDYLWAGLPVVTTSGDSLAELVQREDMGIVVAPGDVASIASAILELALNVERRKLLAEHALRVAERFRWSRVVGPLTAFCDAPRRALSGQLHGVEGHTAPPARERSHVIRRLLGR